MMTVGKPFEDKPFRWSNFTELFNVKTGQKCCLQNLPFPSLYGVASLFYGGMPVVCGGIVRYVFLNTSEPDVVEYNPICLVFQQGSWNQVRQAIRILSQEELELKKYLA